MLLNKPIPARYIFNKVKYDVVYVFLVSLVILFATKEFEDYLPDMPLTIPTFIGTAISILLSFKLSQSYDRWWEARKIWGSIVNDSRSLVLQMRALLPASQSHMIRKIAFRQIGWCYSLGQSLRGLNPLENVDAFISAEELELLKEHNNKALAILDLHGLDGKALREAGYLDSITQVQLNDTLVRLCDAQGRAERIKSTVFPVTYRLFLHAIIYLFVITLSIALRGVAGYFEIPLLLFISAAFFLLEKSATHMQDPFEDRPTDTAVTTIARTIELNLKQLVGEKDIPGPVKDDLFYLK